MASASSVKVVIEATISRMERQIKDLHPRVTRVFIEVQSWPGHRADRETGAEDHEA